MTDPQPAKAPPVRPGMLLLELVPVPVTDIDRAREALIERDTEVGPVEDMGGVLYAPFADPDGNTWTLQHMPWRT
jgi:hypothetical protein